MTVLKALFEKLIETNGIDEEGLVDAIDGFVGEPCRAQLHSLDAVPAYGFLVLWLEDYTWDVQMFRVL